MIYEKTVSKQCMELLKKFQSLEGFEKFPLVGGTNLALRYGHRISVDLDFFTNEEFNEENLKQLIENNFTNIKRISESKQTLLYIIDDVKIDILLYKYKYISGIEDISGIKMLSVLDIIPMKLGAISMRGAKKDFYDIYELLKHYSLDYMIQLYHQKYPNADIAIPIIGLGYFEDADKHEDPISLNDTKRNDIKIYINKQIQEYTKSKIL